VQDTGLTLYACLILHRRAAGWPRTHWYLFRSERSPEGLSLDRIISKVQSVQPGEPYCKPYAFKPGFLTTDTDPKNPLCMMEKPYNLSIGRYILCNEIAYSV